MPRLRSDRSTMRLSTSQSRDQSLSPVAYRREHLRGMDLLRTGYNDPFAGCEALEDEPPAVGHGPHSDGAALEGARRAFDEHKCRVGVVDQGRGGDHDTRERRLRRAKA